jgi:hypothetical protein
MNKLLVVIVLNILLCIHVHANDISDFQIEGLSIGDSLLNFASKDNIDANKYNNQSSNDKYIIYKADKFIQIKQYDYLGVTIKKNDNKYIVSSLSGKIYYKNLNDCYKIRKQIKQDIEKIIKFNDIEKKKYKTLDGKATIYALQLYLKPYPSLESIVINCNHYSNKSGIKNNLSVSINPQEYAFYLINEAYK